MGVVDLLGIISFFLLSLVVRKLVVGYLKDTNAGEWASSCSVWGGCLNPTVRHEGGGAPRRRGVPELECLGVRCAAAPS